MKNLLKTVGASVMGAVIGASAVIYVGLRHHQPKAQTDATPEIHEQTNSDVYDIRNDAFRLRLAEIEKQTHNLDNEASGRYDSDPHTDAPVESPEEADERIQLESERYSTWYESEMPDRTWSTQTTNSLRAGLEKLSGTGFTIDSLDCKTSICKAELTWDSFSSAREESSRVAHQYISEANCATAVFTLPPKPGEANDPYTGVVYYDCTDLRAANP